MVAPPCPLPPPFFGALSILADALRAGNVQPLGKPLLSGPFAKSLQPPTTFRDPCVFEDPDTQEHYIIAGVFVYYITKLKPDMISLAETPKLVNFTNHVYGPCGDGKTDDKPFRKSNPASMPASMPDSRTTVLDDKRRGGGSAQAWPDVLSELGLLLRDLDWLGLWALHHAGSGHRHGQDRTRLPV